MHLDREFRVEKAPADAERGFWASLADDR